MYNNNIIKIKELLYEIMIIDNISSFLKYLLQNIITNNNINQDKKIIIISIMAKYEHKYILSDKKSLVIEAMIYNIIYIINQ